MTYKMMGVIYRAFKEGKFTKTTQKDIENMYYWVKYFTNGVTKLTGRTYHPDEYEEFIDLRKAVQAIFDGNYETAERFTAGFAVAC